MRRVTEIERDALSAAFLPHILPECEVRSADWLTISQFDRWLDEEEANSMVVSYAIEATPEYFEAERLHLRFYEEIYDHYEVFGFFLPGDGDDHEAQGEFVGFSEKDQYLSICVESLREIRFCTVCIPKLRAAIIGNFDLCSAVLRLECCAQSEVTRMGTSEGEQEGEQEG